VAIRETDLQLFKRTLGKLPAAEAGGNLCASILRVSTINPKDGIS
jgi:hypothetical protein